MVQSGGPRKGHNLRFPHGAEIRAAGNDIGGPVRKCGVVDQPTPWGHRLAKPECPESL